MREIAAGVYNVLKSTQQHAILISLGNRGSEYIFLCDNFMHSLTENREALSHDGRGNPNLQRVMKVPLTCFLRQQ